MNDEEVRRLLGRLADRADVGPAPVGDLLRAGRSAERRKRRATIFGAAAASLALIVGGFAVDHSVTRDRPGNVGVSATSPSAASSLPPVIDGMRWVGMGRVVVAVPDTWGTGEVRCGQPLGDTHRVLPLRREPVLPCGPRRRRLIGRNRKHLLRCRATGQGESGYVGHDQRPPRRVQQERLRDL
jgi:hypothetical protein